MIRVFVYGTLLTGERNHQVAAPYLLSLTSGRVRGRLYDAAAGRYPALVLDPNGGDVPGEWFTITEAGLAAMDQLEDFHGPNHPDNLYERVPVTDLDQDIEGWAYVWPDDRGCPPIPGNAWRGYTTE